MKGAIVSGPNPQKVNSEGRDPIWDKASSPRMTELGHGSVALGMRQRLSAFSMEHTNVRGLQAPQAPRSFLAAPLCPMASHTSAGATATGPLLTLHVLQLDDLQLGIPPLTPHAKRHMGVLEQPGVCLRVILVAWAQAPSGISPRPGGRLGVHSNSYRGRSRHGGDRLAVAGHGAPHGSERWVPRVVRAGSSGAHAVPIARARMPFSRNFKSVSARSVGRRSQAFSERFPPGLLAWPSRWQGPGVWVGLLSRIRRRVMSCFRMDHLQRVKAG